MLAWAVQHCNVTLVHAGDTGVSKHFVATWRSVAIGNVAVNLALLAVHFKAFPKDPKSCAQREAQAVVARRLLQNLALNGAACSCVYLSLVLACYEGCNGALAVCWWQSYCTFLATMCTNMISMTLRQP